jgi:hypothetical protein
MLHPRVNHRQRRTEILLAAVVLIAAAGLSSCQVNSGSGQNPLRTPASATISFCDPEASNCDGATSFSATTTRDVQVKVSWQNVPVGSHVQTLELLLPGGNLYQQTQTTFAVQADSSEVPEATQTLPFAGTWIQQRNLMGEWTARVSLDGQAITSQTVQLNP